VILFRKAPSLRIVRAGIPEPPYWAATTIAPYSARRAAPVAIDYVALTASASERLEVTVCDDVLRDLERGGHAAALMQGGGIAAALHSPILIDAAESAEVVYRRGDDALRACQAAMFLTSTRGALPSVARGEAIVVIAAWPLDLARLNRLFDEARERRLRWGVAIPVLYPVTTDMRALDRLAEAAHDALFFAALPVEAEATARKAIAESLPELDAETYDLLFHGDLEPLHVATERHIAALAAELGADDFVIPPRWEQRSNWNGAVLLTLAASRMLAMKLDVETASRIARSARTVAQLDKPIERIAAAAHLSIVESLDEISVDALTEWLESGRSSFVDHVTKQWRLRRA
jgi:hypothetical protein